MKPIQREGQSRGEERKDVGTMSTWIQLDLKPFTHVIFTYISKQIFALSHVELIFCHEIKRHDKSLYLERLSQLLGTVALSIFFFCFPCFLYTKYANSLLYGCVHLLRQPAIPLSSSFLISFTAHVKSQPQEATPISSSQVSKVSHNHTTCCYTISVVYLTVHLSTSLSPATSQAQDLGVSPSVPWF